MPGSSALLLCWLPLRASGCSRSPKPEPGPPRTARLRRCALLGFAMYSVSNNSVRVHESAGCTVSVAALFLWLSALSRSREEFLIGCRCFSCPCSRLSSACSASTLLCSSCTMHMSALLLWQCLPFCSLLNRQNLFLCSNSHLPLLPVGIEAENGRQGQLLHCLSHVVPE